MNKADKRYVEQQVEKGVNDYKHRILMFWLVIVFIGITILVTVSLSIEYSSDCAVYNYSEEIEMCETYNFLKGMGGLFSGIFVGLLSLIPTFVLVSLILDIGY